MDDAKTMIHVRLPKALIRQIDLVAAFQEEDRAKTVENLLEIALRCIEQHGAENSEPRLAQLVALSMAS
ncbi:MAG: hypothetical protein AB7P33_08945 [Dehalococcoidia bacterium]